MTDIASVLSACPLAGCGASPITVYADDREVWSMALNSTGVYWTNGIGDVLSCPLAGCGGALLRTRGALRRQAEPARRVDVRPRLLARARQRRSGAAR